ncbi:MAG: ankyrin repeat domain-containing protein [Treponema sp.]|nr:ankyrin repeat domain-containing protein [Treponema sp.]
MSNKQKDNGATIAQDELDRLFAKAKPVEPAKTNSAELEEKIKKVKARTQAAGKKLKEQDKKKQQDAQELPIYNKGKIIGHGIISTRCGKQIIKVTSLLLILLIGCAGLFSCKSTQAENESIQDMIKLGKIDQAKSFFQAKSDINNQDEDGNTPLHIAAAINDSDMVAFLLIKGANPDLKNFTGKSALHIAVDNNSTDVIPVLIERGSSVFSSDEDGVTVLDAGLTKNESFYPLLINALTIKQKDENGRSIIHHFVTDKNLKAVDFAITANLSIDDRDIYGETPLCYALKNTKDLISVKIAARLLEAGAAEITGETEYFETAVLARNYSLRLEYGQTPLHIAAINNHKGIAEYLLQNNAITSLQDISGATPLHEACRYGNVDIARLLLQNKADPNSQDTLNKTPVELIIPEKSRMDIYKLLVEYHADLNHKDMYGDTVLHVASMINLGTDILDFLVTNGADVNIRNRKGNTALSTAVEHEFKEQITFYVNHGADIHAEDSNHETPLTRVLKNEKGLFESMVTKANVNSVDSKGNTPLLIAIISDASYEKIEYIVNLDANVNSRNRDGNSALYYAVLKNDQKVGELLLSKNANIFASNTQDVSPLRLAFSTNLDALEWLINSSTIKATDGSGNTALHYACDWNLESAVTYLIQKGAEIDASNSNGQTPLFNAAKSDNVPVMDILVKGGANLKHRDSLGSTALHTAVRWNALIATNRLIELGLDPDTQNIAGKTPLAEAAVEGNTEIATLLLSKDADPNVYDTSGKTSLTDAVRANRKDMVNLLLKNGANPQIQDMNGRSPYHEAADMANIEIIRILSNAKSNPLARDKEGRTPLSISFKKGTNVMFAILGSDKNITDSEGNTPVHIAVANKVKPSMLSGLIEKGYPFDTRNSNGYTPLAQAVTTNQLDTVNILLEKGANPFCEINTRQDNVLSLAFTTKNSEILSYIVKYSGNKTDIKGNTVLHYAAKYGDAKTVERLLSYGMDKAVKNYTGETPYDIAKSWKHEDIARLLSN